jgi:dTDP-4-amino-4,6-dideoxygalactose transaminase
LIPYPLRVALAVPAWSAETYRAALAAFVDRDKELDRLKSFFLTRFRVADALLCASGSLALEIALRRCGVVPGDEVIIPTFCCTAVVPPILNVGAVPVLADVGAELNITPKNVAAALTEKTRAVIVPHLFGNPAEIAAITEIAQARNVHVIDDAAQALGATIDSRPVGSFGDAGIVSFGAEKICFGIGGGVALSRHNDFFAGVELPPGSKASAARSFASTVLRRRWRRWTFPAETFFSKPPPDAPPAPYRRETMENLSAAVAHSLLSHLGDNIAARRDRVRMYRELLAGEQRLQLIAHRPGSACLAQVIRVRPKNSPDDAAARVLDVLRGAGYEIQGSYVPIHLLPAYTHWSRQPLRHAEDIWGDLVELPCEPNVRMKDVERIAAIVRRVVG